MPDTLEIEVDGDPVEDGPGTARAPSWGFPVAIAVAAVLALAVLAVVALPRLTNAPHERTALEMASPPADEVSSPTTRARPDERVTGAEAALAAWGRFAVSGDTGTLAGAFDVAGPQFQDLVDQAGAISAAPPGPPAYQVTLADPAVEEVSAGEAVVAGTVVWTRPGEVDQTYQWDVVLHRDSGGRWRVWTVRSITQIDS